MEWGTFPNTMYQTHQAEAPVVADLFSGSAPAHGLLLGPTGCGKTISAALWSWRLLQQGIAVAVLDARGVDGEETGGGSGYGSYTTVAAMAAEQGVPTHEYRRMPAPGSLSTQGFTLYNGNPYHWRASQGGETPASREAYHHATAALLRSILDQRMLTFDADTSPPLVVIIDHYGDEVAVVSAQLDNLLNYSRSLRMSVWLVSEAAYADLMLIPVLARLKAEARMMAIWRQDGLSADAMLRDGLLLDGSEQQGVMALFTLEYCFLKLDTQLVRFCGVAPRTPEERRVWS